MYALGEKKVKSSEMMSSPRASSALGARLANVRARTISRSASPPLLLLLLLPPPSAPAPESEGGTPSRKSGGMGTRG